MLEFRLLITERFGQSMQAFATDIAVYIACPSCSQTGLVDQSTLSAARMRRARVILTCHACGERFDATLAEEVALPSSAFDTVDSPLTSRNPVETEDAPEEEPEPRYATASEHEPLTRYRSLNDVWQHLDADAGDGDDEAEIVPALPTWLQKKDAASDETSTSDTRTLDAVASEATPETAPAAADTASSETSSAESDPVANPVADPVADAPAPDAANSNEVDQIATDSSTATPSDNTSNDINDASELASRLSSKARSEEFIDLTSIEQHLPALPEIGAGVPDFDKPASAQRQNTPLIIFGVLVLIIGLLAGALFF